MQNMQTRKKDGVQYGGVQVEEIGDEIDEDLDYESPKNSTPCTLSEVMNVVQCVVIVLLLIAIWYQLTDDEYSVVGLSEDDYPPLFTEDEQRIVDKLRNLTIMIENALDPEYDPTDHFNTDTKTSENKEQKETIPKPKPATPPMKEPENIKSEIKEQP
eukprot:UN33701